MEIVRIFSANESLYRGKNCSPNTMYLYNLYAISFQISVPIGILLLILEKFVLAFANPGGCTDYGRIDIRI